MSELRILAVAVFVSFALILIVRAAILDDRGRHFDSFVTWLWGVFLMLLTLNLVWRPR